MFLSYTHWLYKVTQMITISVLWCALHAVVHCCVCASLV